LMRSTGSRSDSGDTRPFHALFEEQARLTPTRPALIFEETVLTYGELNAAANRIAFWLRQSGVVPNTPVGLCLERCAEMVTALLGILKAGGAYVPLLPDLPAARLAHQIASTGLDLIVTVQPMLERLGDFQGRILCLDRDRATLDQESAANPP